MTRLKKPLFALFIIGIAFLSTDISYSENLFKSNTQYNTAILKYERDLVDNPQNPELYHKLAMLRYATGDKKKAIEEFQKAKKLYLDQGNIEAALQLESTLNTLTLPEALREIERRIEDLETKVKEINKVLKK